MQLFVWTQELHTLEMTGQETVTQIKTYVASLESIAPEDQVMLLAGMTLMDGATLGQCGAEALSTLEVACCTFGDMLGGEEHLACVGKARELPRWPNGRKRQAEPRVVPSHIVSQLYCVTNGLQQE
ncbi:ubiquitin-like protein FUBI [Lycaon pictus]